MALHASELASIAHLLPAEKVGIVTAVQRISMGLSGADVYALSSTRGELVLRVDSKNGDTARWAHQLRILRRAATHGVAPTIVHVDDGARAIVSLRVAGPPLAAVLGDPAQRDSAIRSLVAQLRTLHALDRTGVEERDPIDYARRVFGEQRTRTGFPSWAAELEPNFAAIGKTLASDPRRVVSHNDLNPGNVLWDGARAWLVDWEVAGLAHPFYDLAVLAMFLRLDDAVAFGLLADQEQGAIDEDGRATFTSLRKFAALLCGLVFTSLVPDLSLLPAAPLSLAAFYADLRAGKLQLQESSGRAAFAAALLRLGMGSEDAVS